MPDIDLQDVMAEGDFLRRVDDELVGETAAALASDPAFTAQFAPIDGNDPAVYLPGLRWAMIGDSITNGSTTTNFIYSILPVACLNVGALVARRDSHEAGTPSETTAQMAARVNTVLAYAGVQGLIILGGTNDANAGVSLATFAANMTAMITAAKRRGIPVIVCTVPPRGSAATAAVHYAVIAYNQWIKVNARQFGVEVADTYTTVVDAPTGYLLASCDSGDGTHPNDLGHSRMGDALARAMQRTADRAMPFGLLTAKHPGVLTPDPLIVGASNKPAGWGEWSGGTGTAPVYTAPVANDRSFMPSGSWTQAAIAASADTNRRLFTGWSTGSAQTDQMLLLGHVEVVDTSGDWAVKVAAGLARAELTVLDNVPVTVVSAGARVPGIGTPGGTYRIGPLVIPFVKTWANAQGYMWLQMIVPSGSSYTFRLGCTGVLNTTTIGSATGMFADWGATFVNH